MLSVQANHANDTANRIADKPSLFYTNGLLSVEDTLMRRAFVLPVVIAALTAFAGSASACPFMDRTAKTEKPTTVAESTGEQTKPKTDG